MCLESNTGTAEKASQQAKAVKCLDQPVLCGCSIREQEVLTLQDVSLIRLAASSCSCLQEAYNHLLVEQHHGTCPFHTIERHFST